MPDNHAPSPNNRISDNDIYDSYRYGILIGAYPLHYFDNVIVRGNTITGSISRAGIGLWNVLGCDTIHINFNNIYGNGVGGMGVSDCDATVDATLNWWGDASGPSGVGLGTGDAVSDNVDFDPWLAASAAPQSTATATGSGTATFSSDVGQVGFAGAISEALLPTAGKPNINFPHGFFSFTITGVPPGGTAIVTITLPSAVPVGTQYWKYHPATQGRWGQIPMGSDDGDNVITITLVDGGLGDDDGAADGTIVDQGGPGSLAVGWETYPINKVRVLLPWIALFAAIIAGASLLVLRRRRAQS